MQKLRYLRIKKLLLLKANLSLYCIFNCCCCCCGQMLGINDCTIDFALRHWSGYHTVQNQCVKPSLVVVVGGHFVKAIREVTERQ